jgi:hypothetical protein
LESSAGERSACAGETNPGRADAVVLVCGTAFIMAEARAELGVLEPKDGDLLDGDKNDVQVICTVTRKSPLMLFG